MPTPLFEQRASISDDDDDNDERVVLHFDVDAMYVACERELNPALRNVPVGVSQYNPHGDLEATAPSDIERRLIIKEGEIKHQKDVNGSLIAVSYEARAAGVKRNDRGLQALQKCPSLWIVQVPVQHSKADLTLYRKASARVMQVLVDAIRAACITKECRLPVEIASIDEVYVDVTEATRELCTSMQDDSVWTAFIQEAATITTVGGLETLTESEQAANALKKDEVRKGSHLQKMAATTMDAGSMTWWHRSPPEWTESERRLAVAAVLAARARQTVLSHFDGVFSLSGGIAANKSLAKLASGLKKPNRQTLIHRANPVALERLFYPLPLDRIRGLGGKLGVSIAQQLQVSTVGQLAQLPLTTLQTTLSNPEMARFLYDIGQGVCHDAVKARTEPKSMECGKTFRGNLAIPTKDIDKLRHWTTELCSELTERVAADGRRPQLLAVHVHFSVGKKYVSKSGTAPKSLNVYAEACLDMILKLASSSSSSLKTPTTIVGMSVSASNFVKVAVGSSSIAAAFKRSADNSNTGGLSQNKKRLIAVQPKKRSSMDQWLSSKGDEEPAVIGKADQPTGVALAPPKKKKVGSLNLYFKQHENGDTVATKNAPPTGVDPQVWAELPEDIRVSVLADIRREQLPRHNIAKGGKSGGIKSFFKPR